MDRRCDDPELALARDEDRVLFEMARGMARGRLMLGRAAAVFVEQDAPARFGFSNLDAYAKEQLSRPGRWLSDCARLAQRLLSLPKILTAYSEGRLSSPSMAELLARHATPESEAELLELALVPGVTVHAMRDFLRCDDPEDDAESERCDVGETLKHEHALLVEATRIAIEHVNGGSDYEWFGSLVGEGASTWPELFNGELMPELWLELDRASERICAGVDEQRACEERAEPGLPVNEVEPGEFPEESIPTGIRELDALMRRISMRLAGHDLVFGRAAIDFFRAGRWRLLGYATERQYCDERLGMGRTPVRERIRLARSCMRLPTLAEAVSTMSIGFESACLLARHVTPRTERAWIERAQKRTFKDLGHELRAVQRDARLTNRVCRDLWPPSDEEMKDVEDFERGVVSGEIVADVIAAAEAEIRIDDAHDNDTDETDDETASAETPDDPIRISADPDEPDGLHPDLRKLADRIGEAMRDKTKRRRKGETHLRWRAHRLEARMYRAARAIYARLGGRVPLIVVMCAWFWDTWIAQLRQEISKYDGIHKRDGYKCASPGCFRRLCTLHHIIRRVLGGDDRWENLLTLCEVCHLQNIHERGSLQVFGKAPDDLTFVFGEVPHFVVRGREKRPAAA